MEMPEFIRKHPALVATITLFVFFLWTLPVWLATVWPMVTSKSFPEWIAGKGLVIGMSQLIYFFLTLGLTVIVIAAFVVTLAEIKDHPVWIFDPLSIAKSIQLARIEFDNLVRTEPFITLRFNVENNSGRVVEIAGVQGFMIWDGDPFTMEPRIETNVSINAGQNQWVAIRQTVSPALAAKLIGAIKTDGTVVNFSLHQMRLTGHVKSKQIEIPLGYVSCMVKGPLLPEDSVGDIVRTEPMMVNQTRYEQRSGNRRQPR